MAVDFSWKLIFILLCISVHKYNAKHVKHQRSWTASQNNGNQKPMIGVIAQETHYGQPDKPNHFFITNSYKRFVEGAGGTVVPILTNMTGPEIQNLFMKINGLLIPGGSTPLVNSPFYTATKLLFDLAMTANNQGDYFPIWGTCLGLQALHVFIVNSDVIITPTDSKDSSWPLKFTNEVKNSRLFNGMSKEIIASLANESLTYNNHKNCVRSDEYLKYQSLRDFFRIISTNKDAKGIEFISTAEAINYPFYSVQWHPEKSLYVTSSSKINHSPHALQASQYMANFFMAEARKNQHVYPLGFMQNTKLQHSRCKYGEGEQTTEECYIV